MPYATTTELADYLGVDESGLPDDADRLLERASELIDHHTFNRIDTDNASHEKAARKAVCAQYEWWAELDDELGIMSKINSISIGDFSVSGGTAGSKITELAPRASQCLALEGLLYSGVSMK